MDRILVAMRQAEHEENTERMQLLAQHDGPSAALHVPVHALDAQRVRVLYAPEQL